MNLKSIEKVTKNFFLCSFPCANIWVKRRIVELCDFILIHLSASIKVKFVKGLESERFSEVIHFTNHSSKEFIKINRAGSI